MTRIAYRRPEDMTERARELTLERGNLNVYRALANAEKVFTGWMLAGRAALVSPVLPIRLRELVILRTAYLMDCRYELGQHDDIARTAGVDGDEIKAITSDSGWQTAGFNAVELAVLQLTTELVTTRSVAAALFDQVHKVLGSEATIEVLMVINRYAGLALMLNALDVDLDETARLPIPQARQKAKAQPPRSTLAPDVVRKLMKRRAAGGSRRPFSHTAPTCRRASGSRSLISTSAGS
jgi:AhpD family alkylhydroperoxidase